MIMNRAMTMVPVTLISALLIVSWVAPSLPLSAEVRTLIAAPLYFLLPMGLGLLLLSLRQELLVALAGRAVVLAWAYFVGLMLVTSLFVAREHGILWQGEVDYWFALICVASLAGFLRSRQLFVFNAGLKAAVWGLLLIAPFFLYAYGIQYFLFSDYPYTDLFQFSHLMKGAGEFAQFDRLNPFNADSYTPAIQVMLGLEMRFFGVEPLFAAWVIPFSAYVLRYLVCYSLARQIVSERRGQVLLAGGMLVLVGGLIPTNGDMAALGSMLLLSLVLQRNRRDYARQPSWAAALSPMAGMLVGVFIAQHSVLIYLLILLLMLTLTVAVESRGYVLQRLMLMAILAYVLAPLHRSSLLFVVLAVLIGWLYARARSGIRPKWRPLVSCAYYGLPPLALMLSLFILWRHNAGDELQFGLLPLVDTLFRALLGTSVINNQDALLGQGSTVALFETARNIGGVLVLIAGSVFLAGWGRKVFREQGGAILVSRRKLYISPRLAWIFGMSAIVVMLVGVPFVYRAAFFPVLLLSIFCIPAIMSAEPMMMRYWGWAASLYVLIAALVYGLFDGNYADPFIASYRLPGLIFALAIACTGALAAARFGSIGRNAWIVPVLLLALLAWDKETARAYFKHYAYGYPPSAEHAVPVSHFTAEDFEAASWLIHHTGDIYIISDPITMSNLRALTGKNSVVSYSNLDTMSESARSTLRNILKSVVDGQNIDDGMNRVCVNDAVVRGFLADSGHSAELNYTLMRRLRPELTGTEVLALFDYGDGLLVKEDRDASASSLRVSSQSASLNHAWLKQDIPLGSSPTTPVTGFLAWIRGAFPARNHAADPSASEIEAITAVVVLTHRTLSWLNDSRVRVDYFFANDRLDDALRNRLVHACGGISFGSKLVLVPLTRSPSRRI